MAQPYIGEIRMFAGNFAPSGWMFCDGQTLPISENDALFTLIGTTYGGDGVETFNLPNLQSRVPIHFGTSSEGISYPLAEMAGTEQETLTTQQMPAHSHAVLASTSVARESSPAGNVPAQSSTADLYVEAVPTASFDTTSVRPVGGSQPHTNFQPYLCVSFIISLFGIFPTQT